MSAASIWSSCALTDGRDGILAGFGEQLIDTATILTMDIAANTDLDYFSSQLIVTNPTAVESIIGGDFDDTFYVQGTASDVTLDGGTGNDHYLLFAGPSDWNLEIDDRGNPWNSGDLIDVVGKYQEKSGFFAHEYPNAFCTAAMLWALLEAQEAGAEVPEKILMQGVSALLSARSPKRLRWARLRVPAVLVLALLQIAVSVATLYIPALRGSR